MSGPKKTVLITGCSDGGLGAALAIAFHNTGNFHVYATARNPAKMAQLKALGIETMTLDVLSDESISACVEKIPQLDMLVNNAGAGYSMPISDLSITAAKQLFDLNVWSYISVTQAFLPLLLKSKGTVVNQTSVASMVTIPFQSTYNASKAAMAVFSDSLRLEMEPFGVKVVDLKTGAVRSNFFANTVASHTLPKGSIYEPVKNEVEKVMDGDVFMKDATSASEWANGVVQGLSKKNPSSLLYGGASAFLIRITSVLPFGWTDGLVKKLVGLDIINRVIRG